MLRYSDGSIQVVGQDAALHAALSMELSNILIQGPRSTGKRTILEKVIEQHRVKDVIRIFNLSDVDMSEVRRASLEASGETRVIFLRLGRMKRDSAERLLKIIEDAADNVVFLATSTYTQDLSISSRFTTLKVGQLNDADVATILFKSGHTSEKAAQLASLSLGSIDATTDAGKSSAFTKLARQALKTIEEHDEDALDALYSKWEDGNTHAITTWARERITERWRVYKADEFPTLGKGTAMRILQRVDYYDRPRYVVRSALASIIREDQG